MNHFRTSDGERIKKSTIDYRTRVAKRQKLEQQRDRFGYNFCVSCSRSDTWIDVSHTISVDEAQKSGHTELCWDLTNMEILCRNCHKRKDGLNLIFNNQS